MRADASCANEVCAYLTVTVDAIFYPVFAAAQTPLSARVGEEFSHSPVLPLGFESGATLSLAEIAGFAVRDGSIVPAEDGGPSVGDYELQLEATHADFLGTIAFTVTANVARGELGADYRLAGWLRRRRLRLSGGMSGRFMRLRFRRTQRMRLFNCLPMTREMNLS